MDGIKRWLITGVGAGLGEVVATQALARGDAVAGTARDSVVAARFQAKAPGRSFGFRLDLRDDAGIMTIGVAAEAALGGIDVLVNNAGYGLVGAVEEASAAEVRDQFQVNLFGQIAMMRAVLPAMRKRRAGRIVNITSVSGLATWAGTGIYCASKFALEAIGRAMAAEVAELGIQIINIAPGGMRTEHAGRSLISTWSELPDYDGTARQAKTILAAQAGAEAGDPEKVARAILQVIDTPAPPLNLLLGADALHYATDEIARLRAEIESWKALTLSTGFDA